jgi:DNA-binding LytR/AlgR family response regulator
MTDDAVHVSPAAGADAPTAGGISPKEASFGVRHRRGFITAAVVGLILAFVGALETSQIAILPRMAYWQILMLSGATIGLGVSEMIERWGKFRSQQWIEMPLIAMLIALPLSIMVVGTSNIFFSTPPPSLYGFSIMLGITFVISLAMTALNYVMHWPDKVMPAAAPMVTAAPAPPPEEPANRFAERLPLPLRGLEIIALEAEDHYLRVHFAGGQSTLILMRMSDAIAELPAEKGAQTHRSWWVAKDAVVGVTKGDGRATLSLAGGVEAPVSRSFYKALSVEGWLR